MPASPPDSPSSPMANDAALIATFYYQDDLIEADQRKDFVNSARKHLRIHFDPMMRDGPYWKNPETDTYLTVPFKPYHRAGNDTTVLQLVLNAKDKAQSATQAWQQLRERLNHVVNKENENSLQVKCMLGYTLTYKAVLTQNRSLNETLTLTNLLPDADRRKLLLSSDTMLGKLAVTDIENGRVWLLKVPHKREDHGLKAEMVYVAVSPIEHEFDDNVLLGPSAVMLMPDLIAHKSYDQIREYRRYDKKTAYSQKLNDTRTTTVKSLEDARQKTPPTGNFNALRDHERLLTGGVAFLEVLDISLEKLLYNYRDYVKKAKEGDIVTFHHKHMQAVNEELKLKIKESHTILKASATAVNQIQSHLDKTENLRLQLITALVGFGAVVVAAAPLISDERLEALWALLKGCATSDNYNTLNLALLQGIITIILGGFGAVSLVLIFHLIGGNQDA